MKIDSTSVGPFLAVEGVRFAVNCSAAFTERTVLYDVVHNCTLHVEIFHMRFFSVRAFRTTGADVHALLLGERMPWTNRFPMYIRCPRCGGLQGTPNGTRKHRYKNIPLLQERTGGFDGGDTRQEWGKRGSRSTTLW